MSKFTSRKFLSMIAGVIMGLALAFGLDEGTMSTVAGAVVSLVSVITYVITEGKVDAAAVGQAAKQLEDLCNALNDTTLEFIIDNPVEEGVEE